MARPERNNVDYFPFFCEEGKKMYYLEETYGNDGFAVFLKILRELAKTDYHYLDLSKNTTLMFLSAKCKVSKETLTSIINDLVELDKFDSVLWSENSIIWCQDFIDSIQDAYIKRKNKCITYDGLLHLLIGLGVRKQSKCTSTGRRNTQSKVEDTKGEEKKVEDTKPPKRFTPPTPDQVQQYCLDRKNNVVSSKFIDHYTSNGWMVGKNKMKDWKAAVRTWENNSINKPQAKQTSMPVSDFSNVTEADKQF